MAIFVLENQKFFELIDDDDQAVIAEALRGAVEKRSKVVSVGGRTVPDEAGAQKLRFDAGEKIVFIAAELNDHVLFALEFGNHPGREQRALAGSGRAGQVKNRLARCFDPAQDFLLGIVGTLESIFVFAGTEGEVAGLEGAGDLGVDPVVSLLDGGRNGGAYEGSQRDGGNKEDASQQRYVLVAENLFDLVELGKPRGHGEQIGGRDSDPGRCQPYGGVEPIAPGR